MDVLCLFECMALVLLRDKTLFKEKNFVIVLGSSMQQLVELKRINKSFTNSHALATWPLSLSYNAFK